MPSMKINRHTHHMRYPATPFGLCSVHFKVPKVRFFKKTNIAFTQNQPARKVQDKLQKTILERKATYYAGKKAMEDFRKRLKF